MSEPFFESVGPVVAAVEPQREESAPVSEPFFESVGPVVAAVKPQRKESAPVSEPFFESVGPVLEQAPEVVPAVAPQETGLDGSEPVTEFAEASTTPPRSVENEILEVPEEPVFAAREANEFPEHPKEEAVVAYEQPNEVFASRDEYARPGTEAATELTAKPIGNDQPHETIFAEREARILQSVKLQLMMSLLNARLISRLRLLFPPSPSFRNQPHLQPCLKLPKLHLLR